ncbi:cop-coated vesicle membrane protein p24 precursor, putative [Plasmodium chabaudi adami]|uniref:Cop-coated vesicle membrane protein p24, putative n=1 Tax=Plasmodium chabaudi adami TaxID=5826 RepID=A0A1D3LMZ6_PLACE|nr:cop-coated vesicle membrane protein p24 precursor, putative [Plasmodium chabaudi adami]
MKFPHKLILSLLYIWGCFLHTVYSTHFTIRPLENDCFYFKVSKNNAIVGSYEIMEKYRSCSITIMSIDDKQKNIVFKSENKQDSFNIKVEKSGAYTFCYHNKKNVELTIMFTIRVKEHHDMDEAEVGTKDDVDKINGQAVDLYSQFLEVLDQQERMMEKADLYKQINDKINSQLIIWSEIEIILLIILTIIHIYYIKSFFEIKTIV